MDGQSHVPATFSQERDSVPFVQNAGRPQILYEQVQKILSSPGLDLQTVQHIYPC